MIPLNPIFLWLLPLVGLPILFHLFLRVKKRSRVFSTLMFFHRADPRLSARKKIREWLALILRMLAILCLLLALSRPVWLAGGGAGGPVAQVLVIDNSASMSAPGQDGRPKIAAALEAAGALVGDMTGRDAAALVLMAADPAVTLPAELVADRAVLRSALDAVKETEAEGSPAAALEAAAALLEARSTGRTEIHVFTDLQENEWGRGALALRLPPFGTQVAVHRIASVPLPAGNVSLAAIEAPRLRMLAGRRAVGSLSLANLSAADASVRLIIADDEGGSRSEAVSVVAGETKRVPLPIRPQTAGLHWVNVAVESDAFAQDNRACLAFDAGSREDVLFLGRPDEFGTLPLAIAPRADGSLSGLTASFTYGRVAADVLRERQPAMAAATWSGLQAMAGAGERDALRAFVERGGILLVVPSQDAPAPAADLPEWLGAVPGEPLASEEGLPVIVFDAESPLWEDLRDRERSIQLRNVKAFRAFALEPAEDARALLGLAGGQVVLTQRTAGEGVVFAAGLAFSPQWTTLPLKQGFLAMAQTMALLRPRPGQKVVLRAAGEPTLVATAPGSTIRVQSLGAGRLEWQGPGKDMPAMARSGVYRVEDGQSATVVAVRSCDREGRMRFVEGDSAPALRNLPHRVDSYSEAGSFAKQVRRARTGRDLFLPLLLAAILCVMAEGWVVNPVPRTTCTR